MKHNAKDITGLKVNKLTVLHIHSERKWNQLAWVCSCECGNETVLAGNQIRSGAIKSCGCSRILENKSRKKHGHTVRGDLNGASSSDLYRIWSGIKTRCYNTNDPSYLDYGARGIKMCERWKSSFSNFLNDIGERPSLSHTIERVNNDGDYEPVNCKWATQKEQMRNTRANNLVTINGETKCVAEWAELNNLMHYQIRRRIEKGWTGIDVIAPAKSKGSYKKLEDK